MARTTARAAVMQMIFEHMAGGEGGVRVSTGSGPTRHMGRACGHRSGRPVLQRMQRARPDDEIPRFSRRFRLAKGASELEYSG